MVNHLLNKTLSQDARISEYYNRGVVRDEVMEGLAQQVAFGEMVFSEAADILAQNYIRDGGDLDLTAIAQERMETRLSELAFRIQEGIEHAPLAVVRSDIHPLAAAGLQIDSGSILTHAQISSLLVGRRSNGSEIEGKHYAKERRLPIDPKTGERRYSTPIGSYDFSATPDKSVSVSFHFAEPAEQAQIYHAHLDAADKAITLIAERVGVAGFGKAGRETRESGHVAWLRFDHHTARKTAFGIDDTGNLVITPEANMPGDPDLHSHYLISNSVFTESGKVGSLDTAAIPGFIKEAGAYYQAILAQNLRDAGFAVDLDPKTGAARMPIVPDNVRTLFSKRTAAGEMLAKKYTEAQGEVWEDLTEAQRQKRMKVATQDKRLTVEGYESGAPAARKDDLANLDDWKRQAKIIGWEPPKSFHLYGPPPPELGHDERIRLAYETSLPLLAAKLEEEAVVPHHVVRTMATRGLIHAGIKGRVADVNAVTAMMRKEGVNQFGSRTPLVWGLETGTRYVSVTTGLHESDEHEFIALARKAAADKSGAIPERLLRQKIEASGLDFTDKHGQAQRQAIERLGTGGRYGLLIAAAGAGKTVSLQPMVAAWYEQGREVWGASLAWRQADDLIGAGIGPQNVKAFSVLINGMKNGSIQVGTGSVVAVDEWGLLGTRQALELLRLQDRHGFSIVALGDPRQCAAITAGNLIDLTRRALGPEQVPEILTTKRQATEQERHIAHLFRDGRAAEALHVKREDGSAEMVWGGYTEVIVRVAKLYAERVGSTGEAPAISAPTNSDAHRIGEAVRVERRKMGLIGDDIRRVNATYGQRNYSLALAKGDHVRLFRSSGMRLRNGSVAEVVDLNERGLTLKSKSGKIGLVPWERLKDESGRVQLAYGYAMTIHTAQGSTAKEHIFTLPAGSQAVNGRLGYTANTRHVEASWILTSEVAERADIRKRRPLNDTRPIDLDDKWANVARSLSWSPEKDSAIALIERIGNVRRGTVREFHIMVPSDIRQQVNRPHSRGHEVAHRRKMDLGLKQTQAMVRAAVRQIEQVRYRVVQRYRSGPSLSP